MVFIKSFKGQNWLLPPNVRDMIPEDHICFLVEDVVDRLDCSEFEIKYSGPGHPAYHPRVLVKVLVQAMLDRVRSSRAIARNVRENVVFIHLAEKLDPDFRTISDFRKANRKLLKDVFKATVSVAKELGAIGLEHLSIDGSKLKASASNRSTVTGEELNVIEEYVNNELKEGIKLDRVEDEQFKNCRGYDQLKETSKKKIKALIAKYMKQVNKGCYDRVSEIKDTVKKAKDELENNQLDKVSLTDPESRFMKNKKGRIEYSYSPQITTDDKSNLIVANDVCQDVCDINQLKPQVELVEENCGELKERTKISADTGYYSGGNINFLNKKNLDGYIPDQRDAQKAKGKKVKISKFDKINFKYDNNKDEYTCPEGFKLKFSYESYDKQKKKTIREYRGTNCKNCPYNKECTKSKYELRKLYIYPFEKERIKMAEKMQTKEAKEIYKKRKEIVEPPIGHIKENLGFRNFLTRRLDTVKNEFNLACTAYNIKKIWILIQQKKKEQTDQSVLRFKSTNLKTIFLEIKHNFLEIYKLPC